MYSSLIFVPPPLPPLIIIITLRLDFYPSVI